MKGAYYKPEQVKTLIYSGTITPEDSLLFRILYNWMFRIAEVLKFTPKDLIKDEHGYGLILRNQKNKEKNQIKPIGKRDYELLTMFIGGRNMGTNEKIFPISQRTVERRLVRYCKKLNIPYKGTHAFRRGRITELRNLGHSPEAIQAISLHKDIRMITNVYDQERRERTKSYLEDGII